MTVEDELPLSPIPGTGIPSPSSIPPSLNAAPLPASASPFDISHRSPPPSRNMPPPLNLQPPRLSTSNLPLQMSDPLTSALRPNFSPFFTIINDNTTQSTYHPSRVHYIFSDDDESELLMAACVRSLQDDVEDENAAASREMAGSGTQESETSSSSSTTFKKGVERRKKTDGKGKTLGKREERAVIVDINETGDGVVRASSLRASWQIINTEISNAPTISNDNTGGDAGVEEGERALMLKIEGIGISDSSLEEEFRDIGEKKGKGAGENSVMGEEEMLALLEGFDRKMSVLRKIAASGENTDEMRRVKSVGDVDGAKEL